MPTRSDVCLCKQHGQRHGHNYVYSGIPRSPFELLLPRMLHAPCCSSCPGLARWTPPTADGGAPRFEERRMGEFDLLNGNRFEARFVEVMK